MPRIVQQIDRTWIYSSVKIEALILVLLKKRSFMRLNLSKSA